MAFTSNGQISYLVLDSLSHGSKYGLEIIEFISQKTGGSYIMKKPTLYSCLSRMEKKGLVSSSYWGESELGGKRHYYTITNSGKQTLEELAKEFDGFSFESEESTPQQPTTSYSEAVSPVEEKEDVNTDQKPVFLQQDNIFDIVKNKPEAPAQQPIEEENEDIVENQIDIFSYTSTQPETIEETVVEETENTEDIDKIQYYQSKLEQTTTPVEEKTEEIKDDAKFLEREEVSTLTPYQEAQNRKLYDTSSDLKKYRSKKSFSENQIEMSVVYENEDDREVQKSRIEQLKQSMLNARQNGYNSVQTEEQSIETQKEEFDFFDNEEKVEAPISTSIASTEKDDAVFITEPRLNASDLPIQKKITPPNIEVNIYDDNLPAPKRNSNLEPTYKDMLAKLFERKKEKEKIKTSYVPATEEVKDTKTTVFADYDSLKKYYGQHNIEFKEYKKTKVERRHNTNLLNFVSSTILLLLVGVCSGVIFGILNALNLLRPTTNFMYYTIPALFLIYTLYLLIKTKFSPSKKAVLIYNSLVNWAICILSIVIVFVINIFCGMQFETMQLYLTSLLLPSIALLLILPINYYIKKYLYKKFGK